MQRGWKFLLSCLFATIALGMVVGHATALDRVPPHTASAPPAVEALLAETLNEIGDGDLNAALIEIDKVLKNYPNFRLAHLIKGDLLLARARPIDKLGAAPDAPRERLQDLRDEARARLARSQFERPTDRVPKYLLQLNSEQKYALVVDTARSTLYVFENHNGQPRYLADYYVSSGKNGAEKTRQGDKRTPLGVYQVVASLPRAQLADLYGVAAYPINYPNEWDRREGRNGYGIWLHGTPADTYSRPPRASDGCVVLTNQDIETIRQNLQIGVTPVIIADNIEWVDPEEVSTDRETLLKKVEVWRRDWESRNTDNYLKHYARGFSTGTQDITAWSQQKRQVNAGKSWIKVKLEAVSMFLYPGRDDLAVVTFEQDYSSNNLSNSMKKRQYWINENGTWRILYEGAA